MKAKIWVAAIALVFFTSLALAGEASVGLAFKEATAPTQAKSLAPNLSKGANGAYLSWMEPAIKGGFTFRFAAWTGQAWSEPKTIAEGPNLLANWADTPGIHEMPNGRIAAYWLESASAESEGYSIRVATSADQGLTWSAPATPHEDKSEAEHGFVSVFDAPDEGLGIVWLDGRAAANHSEGHGVTALMTRTLFPDGQLGPETVLDPRTCDCCPTSAAQTKEGAVLLAYRSRSDAEIRDIRAIRLEGGAWSQPALIHEDGWKIDGCPVNGPAVAAEGNLAVVGWSTGAGDKPSVRGAFSKDGGKSFDAPIQIDDGNPIGRGDVVLLEDGSAVFVWIEKNATGAEIRVSQAHPGKSKSPSFTVAEVSAGHSSGSVRLLWVGKQLLLAWTSMAPDSRVKTAVASW